MSDYTREPPAESGERCTPARQALVVHITSHWGEVGSCGRSDGGRSGRYVFCGEPAGHFEERCWRYTVLPDTVDPDNWRLDPEPGPEAA
jgi:hypothetical protein